MASKGDIDVKDVMPILFDNWPKVEFELSTQKAGLFTKLKSKEYFSEGKFPVIDQGDKLISGYINDESLLYQGELPIIIFGDHTRKIKYIDFSFAVGADGTKIIKPLKVYNPKFYFYYLNSLRIPDFGYSRHFKVLKSITVPLPPLKEQQRIVAKLDTLFKQLDDIKTRLDDIPGLLKNFRQAVLNQAVTGKLTEEWRIGMELESADDWRRNIIEERKKLKLPKRTPGLEFEEAPFPYDIPEKWTFGYLQNFGEFTRGKSKHRPRNDKRLFGGKYPFIQTGDVARSKGLIENYTQTYSEFGLAQSRLFPKGTLCITIAANIAETGILNFDSCFPDSVVGYLPYRDLYSSKFAMYYLRTIQQDLEHYAPATAQKNINLGILFKVAFPVPPKEEQTEIVKRVDNLFSKVDLIQQRYEALVKNIETLPQALLEKAFNGELVEQLPTDGDAKDLLEEIQKLKEQDKNTTKRTQSKPLVKKELVGKSEGKAIVTGTLLKKERKTTEEIFDDLKKNFVNKKFTFGEIQIPSKYTYDEFRIQLFKLLDEKIESNPKLNMVYNKGILYFQIPKK
jgi:type I restriction enzyme S subunit